MYIVIYSCDNDNIHNIDDTNNNDDDNNNDNDDNNNDGKRNSNNDSNDVTQFFFLRSFANTTANTQLI